MYGGATRAYVIADFVSTVVLRVEIVLTSVEPQSLDNSGIKHNDSSASRDQGVIRNKEPSLVVADSHLESLQHTDLVILRGIIRTIIIDQTPDGNGTFLTLEPECVVGVVRQCKVREEREANCHGSFDEEEPSPGLQSVNAIEGVCYTKGDKTATSCKSRVSTLFRRDLTRPHTIADEVASKQDRASHRHLVLFIPRRNHENRPGEEWCFDDSKEEPSNDETGEVVNGGRATRDDAPDKHARGLSHNELAQNFVR